VILTTNIALKVKDQHHAKATGYTVKI